ncbi:kinase [Candidatus Giovannonibacteria bacterium RIFCSPLOWO2_02_FULL_43_11b]|uniref:Kinase n=1 Tax=Candidatus Giovannonibacteria bacterium RIFCSPHIGHO2_12_FULL_43_15 TaxID=1798341 RepID=A0A1F5WP19_9BACT|nr:MAG: kinase [Candidatus Giovannonibacteria bacterium RIFCSPHIGHO2_01_FULL_43_100]OGF66310.1 MAG: kinase [Candidatus Giovannonibacteria bacterium RIFCSPHIGHO2_02_FULL_43_32]OGF77380.1 MAG: kinase [Candidatus Giovannonibacteria bacterium RIFCSPHIGHO2_12_FULL_43_15]OGF79203.1 MAG: kinase [Candidatus Giovannonibacteria bacterium RIFCSPLOWO2_01_FULL_43_60]OGF90524.1 MAG: kinase [Candidatus Giovannonibacteria bacterium RIFCSPLOWO2_02_FULL_43_11b]OGF92405.1 MAG: kinase [Candidatus Giovannonibacter
MIFTKTPFRISFFGGGTDYPAWYEKNGGAVLSTTIDKYCYIMTRYLPPFFDFKYRIRYTEREEVKNIDDIKHPKVRECLKFFNLDNGIEMVHSSDIPAMSGMGSSSAFTVGFLNALYTIQSLPASKMQLALDAIKMEQEITKENVGSQDQVAAAFGGFNKIEFGGPEKIRVMPISVDPATIAALQDRLMIFFTGYSRNASEIAADQIRNIGTKESELRAMGAMVPEAVKILSGGPARLHEFGKLLDESWKLKRGLSPLISNEHTDDMYNAARDAGALGGKLLGAGGGGFMLVFAEPENHATIEEKLGKFLRVPFHFENAGSQVIFKADNEAVLA